DERDEHCAQAEVADALVAREVEDRPAEQAAQHADHDRAEATGRPTGARDAASERAGDEPDDDPGDDPHTRGTLLTRTAGRRSAQPDSRFWSSSSSSCSAFGRRSPNCA